MGPFHRHFFTQKGNLNNYTVAVKVYSSILGINCGGGGRGGGVKTTTTAHWLKPGGTLSLILRVSLPGPAQCHIFFLPTNKHTFKSHI